MKYDTILRVFLCYLLGSIPFSVLASKYLLKKDLRSVGSGNIGTSNAYRAGGAWFSLLVALFDISKGFVAVKLIMPYSTLAILAVCVGQMFPVFLNFKGGKGVGCYLGSLLGYDSVLGIFFISGWLFLTKASKLPFLASLIILIASMFFFFIDKFTIPLYLIILFKHRKNFTEFINKLKLKKYK